MTARNGPPWRNRRVPHTARCREVAAGCQRLRSANWHRAPIPTDCRIPSAHGDGAGMTRFSDPLRNCGAAASHYKSFAVQIEAALGSAKAWISRYQEVRWTKSTASWPRGAVSCPMSTSARWQFVLGEPPGQAPRPPALRPSLRTSWRSGSSTCSPHFVGSIHIRALTRRADPRDPFRLRAP